MPLYNPAIPVFTWATKPASPSTGFTAFLSNVGTKGSHWFYDGTRWKPMGGAIVLATLDTTSSSIANTDTLVFSYQMPSGLLQLKDRLRLAVTMTKSGTTDTGVFKVRVGTAGTIADTQVMTNNLVAAANLSATELLDFRLETATTLLRLGTGTSSGLNGYSTVSSLALPAVVTITDATANALYVSVTISSSSTNDTVALVDAQLQLRAKAN